MEIEYTAAFLRQLRRLSRRYRHIREDIEPVIRKLQVGKLLGDQIPHAGLTLFKVRILVTIYSKFNQGDITAEQVRTILAEHETPRLTALDKTC